MRSQGSPQRPPPARPPHPPACDGVAAGADASAQFLLPLPLLHLAGCRHHVFVDLVLCSFELHLTKFRIEPPGRRQFSVRPALHDPSLIQDDDLVRVHHGGQPVRYYERRPVLH